MAHLKNHGNEYAAQLDELFERIPKSVFAAIAVSYATTGGDWLERAKMNVCREWRILHEQGIVPQKPTKEAMECPIETRPLEAWHITGKRGGGVPIRQRVASISEAAAWLDAKARLEVDDDSVEWNAQGLEVLTGEDQNNPDNWEEWYDDEGRGIDDYRDPDFT